MPEGETEAAIDPYGRNAVIVGVIMMATLSFSVLTSIDTGEGIGMMWFWSGIALSIVFLLCLIASNLEALRAEI